MRKNKENREAAPGGRKNARLWGISICAVLAAVLLFMAVLSITYRQTDNDTISNLENQENLSALFQNNYALYKDLYEKVNGTTISYGELYSAVENNQDTESSAAGDSSERSDVTEEVYSEQDYENVKELLNNNFATDLSTIVGIIGSYYDYNIVDTKTGTVISNTNQHMSASMYDFYIELVYDQNGNVSIPNAKSQNTDSVLRQAALLARNKAFFIDYNILYNYDLSSYSNDLEHLFRSPQNCTVTYGITYESYKSLMSSYNSILLDLTDATHYYVFTENLLIPAVLLLLAIAFLLPWEKLAGQQLQMKKKFNIPLEALVLAVFFIASFAIMFCDYYVSVMNGIDGSFISVFGSHTMAAELCAFLLCASILLPCFALIWYAGLCLHLIFEQGVVGYIKKNSLIYRLFPMAKSRILQVYNSLENLDITKDARKTILKVVLVNAVILFVISSLWFGGFMITIVYSVILYIIMKVYISRLQQKYGILLSKVNEISNGNLHVEITEDLGVFEPFKLQLLHIQEGFRSAVEEETKSQRMKAELITNVSHDLKTPLTAIITYVNLLKEDNITEEQRREYLDTLDRKSLRLKVLIEDLFEMSKANSGNVTLNPVKVDLFGLVKQVEFELSDKLAEKSLEVRLALPEEKCIAFLDSQRTYRIYENFFINISKYSMPGTRVYVTGYVSGGEVIIELKNISSTELLVRPEELTERFVRGDSSRNTEGSGLGLAIAKSFVEMQGGRMMIQIDGDLFKVTTAFPYLDQE